MKAVPAPARTACDYSVDNVKRFIELVLRRRVRLRGDGELVAVALAGKLMELLTQ